MNAKVKNVIDTGLVEFELPFDRGTEKIYFNPDDVDLYIRIADMIEKISKMYDDMSPKYEEAEGMQKLEIVRDLNQQIKDAFDEAFGNNVSSVIFKYVSPNAIVKSKKQYYPFYILDYLMPIVAEETGKTAKQVQSALDKAMKKHSVQYEHKLNR